MARYLALGLLALSGVAVGSDGCHFDGEFIQLQLKRNDADIVTHQDDSIGKTCAFANYDSYLEAASLYCYQFRSPFYVPKGDSQSNIYQMKIGRVPDGYGGQQIFWGMLMGIEASNKFFGLHANSETQRQLQGRQR
jgi:hypothetical protein